jgi:hypothetical protein
LNFFATSDHKCRISLPKKRKCYIQAKDIFGKIDPRKKKVEIQTITSCMSLGYNRVPNNLYFPL